MIEATNNTEAQPFNKPSNNNTTQPTKNKNMTPVPEMGDTYRNAHKGFM